MSDGRSLEIRLFFFLLRTEYLKLEATAGMGVSCKKIEDGWTNSSLVGF